ncbi:uncharacterized protein N0V89_005484 [Didymosphaeria variabile]|uniref:3-carboxymuconate cyclase n=1 Tax=Didymosphaeria variabile TaxID=1932322 RepID=A0A9W9CBI7_9PLEO|nr:uncharacterized protein N0V89_005484 [Didymosphaeria variabile]KAJ4353754.1 hypothetical protein N0V89_005484 [Didymosphaeria variabile]
MTALPTKVTLLFAVLAAFGETAPWAPKNTHWHQQSTTGKAIYYITNEAENAVVALPIKRDGSLAAGKSTKTGGAGAVMIQAATGKLELPDGLSSQSSLTLVGNNIFAVNPGSNTVSMLAIDPADPLCLTVVGKPVAVPGEFPNTVAASAKNNLVCVATTGAVAGVSCASFSHRGIGPMDKLRPFDIGQSTPPKGPLNTVSQTLFSADETKLLTMVKGDPMVNKTGYLSVFEVKRSWRRQATLATQDVRSSPNGTAVLFGTSRIPGSTNSLFTTDASFGAAIIDVDHSGQATAPHEQKIDGQAATCWATISPATGSAFVTDAAVDRIVEMNVKDASIIKEYDLSANRDPGLLDLASAGNFVYALSPGNGTTDPAITVLDVSGGQGSAKQAQRFSLSGFATSSAQGMAVFL